jgi:hypothetical protein
MKKQTFNSTGYIIETIIQPTSVPRVMELNTEFNHYIRQYFQLLTLRTDMNIYFFFSSFSHHTSMLSKTILIFEETTSFCEKNFLVITWFKPIELLALEYVTEMESASCLNNINCDHNHVPLC